MGFIANIRDIYFNLNEKYADPRTNGWFLVSSPIPVIAILALYLSFCLKYGPTLMKNKKGFTLRTTMQYYNLFQIFFSIFLVYRLSKLWINQYSFKCEPIDYSDNSIALSAASTVYWYFFSKVTELFETVLFVMRKKQRQVTILHLYHHTSMVILTWLMVKYYAGGFTTLPGYINSIVHVFMYLYYFLSALGPQYEKSLWWKKYITILQLLQFTVCLVVLLQALPRDCAYPKSVIIFLLSQSGVFAYMFGKFYVKTYAKKSSKRVLENRFPTAMVHSNHIVHKITKNEKHLFE